jgi:hypothetical protein
VYHTGQNVSLHAVVGKCPQVPGHPNGVNLGPEVGTTAKLEGRDPVQVGASCRRFPSWRSLSVSHGHVVGLIGEPNPVHRHSDPHGPRLPTFCRLSDLDARGRILFVLVISGHNNYPNVTLLRFSRCKTLSRPNGSARRGKKSAGIECRRAISARSQGDQRCSRVL